MKNICFKVKILAMSCVLFTLGARAQVDPASSLLIRSTSDEAVKPNLDSGRYTVRPTTQVKSIKTEKPAITENEVKRVIKEKMTEAKIKNAEVKAEVAVPASPIAGDDESVAQYSAALHAEDPRQNLANISAAPGLFYLDSSSSYWFRNYHSSGPGIAVTADIWVTPFLGVNIDYFTTLAAELDVDPTASKSVLVDHRYSSVGLQFRKYSSLSRKSPAFNFGINFADYQLIIPKEETNRSRISSTGLALSFLATLPKTVTSAWFFGATLLPKLKVTEEKNATQIKSGTDSVGYGIKFQIGQRFTLNRHNQIFWRASHRLDKVIYAGAANTADPVTTLTPQGVSVTSGASLFEVGYSWGD